MCFEGWNVNIPLSIATSPEPYKAPRAVAHRLTGARNFRRTVRHLPESVSFYTIGYCP